MGDTFRLGLARQEDLDSLAELRSRAILAAGRQSDTRTVYAEWADVNPRPRQLEKLRDNCLWVIRAGGKPVATNGLDLGRAEMVGLFVLPEFQGLGLGRKLVAAIEQCAARFGMLQLTLSASTPSIPFYRTCGYIAAPNAPIENDPRSGMPSLAMLRSFPRRQSRYGAEVQALHAQLGITSDYGRQHCLPLQPEARQLTGIGPDAFGRDQQLHPRAAQAWQRMLAAAATEGVSLQVASAYRTLEYQAGIIRRKLARGQTMGEILGVSAAPGFSEHHTGRALDLTTPGSEALEQEFEHTAAFAWLCRTAHQFGFNLSYPRDNHHGILYEPWHWFHSGRRP